MRNYYSVEDISVLTNVNTETVRRWIRTGELKASIESKREGFDVEAYDFMEFLDKNRDYRDIATFNEQVPSKLRMQFLCNASEFTRDKIAELNHCINDSMDEMGKTISEMNERFGLG